MLAAAVAMAAVELGLLIFLIMWILAWKLIEQHGRKEDGRTYTVTVNGKIDRDFTELATDLGKSHGETFKLGLALLKLSKEAEQDGWRLALIGPSIQVDGTNVKEI